MAIKFVISNYYSNYITQKSSSKLGYLGFIPKLLLSNYFLKLIKSCESLIFFRLTITKDNTFFKKKKLLLHSTNFLIILLKVIPKQIYSYCKYNYSLIKKVIDKKVKFALI